LVESGGVRLGCMGNGTAGMSGCLKLYSSDVVWRGRVQLPHCLIFELEAL